MININETINVVSSILIFSFRQNILFARYLL